MVALGPPLPGKQRAHSALETCTRALPCGGAPQRHNARRRRKYDADAALWISVTVRKTAIGGAARRNSSPDLKGAPCP